MDAPLKQIKGYEVRERIGAGGFGAVYKAYQTTIGREVAIKFILPDRANQPEFIRRFESEAQLVARLEHPHIVPLYDYWRDPDGAYLVMRWLRGGSLRDALEAGPFDLRLIVPLLDQIASALSLAHRDGIIHRDIKPGNILLDQDGNAYLTDFGIAKDLGVRNHTATDMLVGSLDYLSPEQARGEPVTPRTDIYSLGVTLYEVITGKHPFEGVSSVERLYKHINDPLPRIENLDADVRDAVNAVIQKATAKNPDDRHPDVLALAAEFRQAIGAGAKSASVEAQLTQREHEILQLIVDGMANKEIAQHLTLTLSTVKWHVNQIYGKLGVRSRVQAIIRARELDLLGKGDREGATVHVPTVDFNPINPYKGLLAFQSADAQNFFGREKITDALIRRLSETGAHSRFLAVVGPSGSGKSSLVKAGLIPAVWRGALPGSERWFVAEMLPGTHPIDELEVALTRVAANQADNLHGHLSRNERGLVRCASLILPNDGTELLLVIDQFEEVYTLTTDEAERAHFLALLCAAVTEPRSRVRIIITLRADFYDRPLHDPHFGDLVRSRLETIMPLSTEEMERAIVRPADRVGITFEQGLVSAIIGDVNYQPGALPLLQFALTELFERRQGRLLTREAYDAIGGTTGALAKRAEAVYMDFAERDREIVRQIFLRLMTPGDGADDTRRRAARSEFKAIAGDSDVLDDILDTLASYRLLALDTDPATRAPTVELAHEALLREWERLRAWLNEARDDIRTQRQLTGMAEEWRTADHDVSFLARGSRLAQFETWGAATTLQLSQVEREFLEASLAQRQRDAEAEQERQAREQTLERRSRTFLRGLVAVLLLALIGAVALTVFAFDREEQALQARVSALSAQATSEHNFARAEQQRLFLAAENAMDNGATGNVGMALALRSLAYGYTPGADAALMQTTRQGLVLQEWVVSQSNLYSVAYSPNGEWIAAATDGGTLIIDSSTGELTHTLEQGGTVVWTMFSPTGTRLLTTGATPVVYVWDVTTGERLQTLVSRENVEIAYFSQDGEYVISQTNTAVQLWETETGARGDLISLNREDGQSVFVYIHRPAQSYFVVRDDNNRFTLERADTGETLCTLVEAGTSPNFIWWSDFDPYLVIEAGNHVLQGWNFETCTRLGTFSGHDGAIRAADYDPRSDSMVTVDNSQIAYQWSLQSGSERARYISTGGTSSIDIAPDGSRLIMPNLHSVSVIDMSVQPEPRTIPAGFHTEPYVPRFSPDGQSLFVGGFGRYARWDLTAQASSPIFTYEQPLRVLDFSPDGGMLATSLESMQDFDIYLLDTETGAQIRTFAGHQDSVNFIDVSPSGRHVASGSFDNTARSWDMATGELLHLFSDHEGIVSSAVFSPDETLLITSSTDGTARLWDVVTGEQLHVFEVGEPVIYADFSPNGRLITASDTAGFGHIWEVETRTQLHRLVGHTATIWTALFSPDGTQVVTASWDGTARIWDVATGETVRVLDNGREKALYWAEFSPDGAFVVTGGRQDDRVDIWRADLEATIAALCDRPLAPLTAAQMTQYGITDDQSICPSS